MPGLKSFLVAAILVVASVAQAQQAVCPSPAKPMLRAELYFGRNIGGHLGVSERDWSLFVARELTTRFPDGLTVIDGHGQWRGRTGAIVREPNKIVIVFVPDDVATRERIKAATAAYKRHFKQDSVAIITRAVCVEF